jgi:hypothetical protein
VNAETRAEAACGRRDMRRISGKKDAPFAEAFRNPGTDYPWVGAKHSEHSLANAKGAGDDRPAIGFAEAHLHVCGCRLIFDAYDTAIQVKRVDAMYRKHSQKMAALLETYDDAAFEGLLQYLNDDSALIGEEIARSAPRHLHKSSTD